jgi:predicted RND superfamily exporter protein
MRQGKTKHKAIAESLRINLQPIFLTTVTTAIGFLSMNFSDVPPFRDLGSIVAMGVMAAFVYSVCFLPSMMAVLPVRVKPKSVGKRQAFDLLADFVINRRKLLFWGMLVLIAVLATGTLRIELNDNFSEYWDKRYDIRRATDFLHENMTGLTSIEYSLGSGEAGGINDPEYLAKVEEFANWYRSQPDVGHVNTITDTMKRLNKNMHGDDEAYYRIPGERDLAAQYLLLYEMSLPFGLDLNNQINVDKSATRMIVTFKDVSSRFVIESDEKARNWLTRNAPETMFTHGASMSIMFANISKRNIESMLGASFMALVLISFVLMLTLRIFKLGLASLIPNITPAFMAFGIWGMMVGRVGLAVSVIGALTLGIVVDDTVHFVSKYLRARREHGATSAEAVRYSFNTVGAALLITTVILVAGFTVVSFSGFKPNSQMGIMTVITISLALILDFLFLPALLMKVEK